MPRPPQGSPAIRDRAECSRADPGHLGFLVLVMPGGLGRRLPGPRWETGMRATVRAVTAQVLASNQCSTNSTRCCLAKCAETAANSTILGRAWMNDALSCFECQASAWSSNSRPAITGTPATSRNAHRHERQAGSALLHDPDLRRVLVSGARRHSRSRAPSSSSLTQQRMKRVLKDRRRRPLDWPLCHLVALLPCPRAWTVRAAGMLPSRQCNLTSLNRPS